MDIVVNYGKDISGITYEALACFEAEKRIPDGARIAIKPNLINATHPSQGATTHPEVVDGIIRYLLDNGFNNITIMESAWAGCHTDRAFKATGFDKLVKQYDIPFLDLKRDKMVQVNFKGTTAEVCSSALNTDFLINVPVLKAHCQTRLTCCLKNLKGCISDKEKRHFHATGLHKPIAALNGMIKTHLCVIDSICGDLTFEEGGTPLSSDRVIIGSDPVLLDSFAAGILGYQPEDIGYLAMAGSYGLGNFIDETTKVQVLNGDRKPPVVKADKHTVLELARHIDEREACSSCYAALIRAMYRTGTSKNMRDKICIGQGFKDIKGEGVGVGNCTCGLKKSVSGCPPAATDIIQTLGWG